MKTGVLPIGTNAGGIKEVIKHEETGFIVNIGDSDKSAICDSALRKSQFI